MKQFVIYLQETQCILCEAVQYQQYLIRVIGLVALDKIKYVCITKHVLIKISH